MQISLKDYWVNVKPIKSWEVTGVMGSLTNPSKGPEQAPCWDCKVEGLNPHRPGCYVTKRPGYRV